MSILNIENLTTRLASEAGWVHALDQLSLCIEQGKTFALVGESGCGKSMTALSIARLLPDCGAVVAGKVLMQTQDLLQLPETAMRSVRGKRISMIFQEPGTSLNPVMTVGDQLTEVITLHTGASRKNALEQAATWLEKVGIPEPKARLNQYPFEMSGGQKQRVMIAMALAVQPDLLIADEPTTALDVSIQAQVLDLLKSLQKEQGMAMLLITHDLAIVKQMADHVGLMYAGQLVETAEVNDFFAQPSHPYAQALIRSLPNSEQKGHSLYALPGRVPSLTDLPVGCRFASRCGHARNLCEKEPVPLRSKKASLQGGGHKVRCHFFEIIEPDAVLQTEAHQVAEFGEAPVRLVVENLQVAYFEKRGFLRSGHKPVLKGLNFRLSKGQTIALVGESGSGKTTAARALLGLLSDSTKISGRVQLDDLQLLPRQKNLNKAAGENWRSRIQFVFQDPFASLNPRHRVFEILEEPLIALRPEMSMAQRESRIHAVIEQVNLSAEILSRFPHEFSGGQRQRIAIARALVSEPGVLVCDEPTSALDVSVQAQILNLLKQLQRDTGVAMLFITHNLSVVQYLADEVIVLKAGEVVESGPTRSLFGSPQHEYTRTLLNSAPRL